MAGSMGVLVVSGNAGTIGELTEILRELDFEVLSARSTARAGSVANRHPLAAVIVDVRAPRSDPARMLGQLRRHTAAPVLMLTSDDSAPVGRCLELGAEDCMRWPGTARELRARVRLRTLARAGNGTAGDLAFDAEDRSVVIDGRVVPMTDREFELLAFMARSPGVTFTSDQLLTAVWASSREWQSISTVREHVYRLRHKLEREPGDPKLIVTVRGHGYRFDKESLRPPRHLTSS